MITGFDVSHHQATTPSLAGQSFLIARASYGSARDGMFATHIGAARRAGLVTGAYLFGRHGDVGAQVVALLSAIEDVGGVDLVALDLEADGDNPPMSWAEARDAIERIQSTGRPVGLYHSTSGYPTDALGADWRWVADYRPLDHPPVPWDVWQFRGSPLDLDRFDGTVDELRNLGRSAGMAPITDETPKVIAIAKGARLYDLDGTTVLATTTGALAGRPSPFGVGSRRATFATVGYRRLVLVTPLSVADPPAPDCSAEVRAELDAAATRAAAAVRNQA